MKVVGICSSCGRDIPYVVNSPPSDGPTRLLCFRCAARERKAEAARKPVNVLFLDFDGVLVTLGYQLTHRGGVLDPLKVALLASIVHLLDLRIVVSSSWRTSDTVAMVFVLKQAGFHEARDFVIGVTPRIPNVERGIEIGEWIKAAQPAVDRIVILDDDNDMGVLVPWLVRTDSHVGLTEAHFHHIRGRLDKPLPARANETVRGSRVSPFRTHHG